MVLNYSKVTEGAFLKQGHLTMIRKFGHELHKFKDAAICGYTVVKTPIVRLRCIQHDV